MVTGEVKTGKLFVITGPSGVGKGTILSNFFHANKENVIFSISMTTRSPRPNEEDGVNYFFVTKEEFKKAVDADEFLEWTEYSGNFYGTNKKFVMKKLNSGVNVILEIEAKGAMEVMKKFGECVSVFLMPPNLDELEARLRGRMTEDEDSIQKRLHEVRRELDCAKNYKYTIVNDEIENACMKLQAVYDFECGKSDVQP